jgi:hypothetical protein
MARKPSKLFNLLVVLGASMTAGSAAVACGGGGAGDVDPQAAKDAANDARGGGDAYGRISSDVSPADAYPTIKEDPRDSGNGDVYAHIGFPMDAGQDVYANISPYPGDI